jgi:hypothetical protein
MGVDDMFAGFDRDERQDDVKRGKLDLDPFWSPTAFSCHS